jgi:glycosyltransferase involved in cell wall biosynthesis
MTKLKVSIITVVLNRVKVVEQAISSVQTQDYSNIEHVIIDGVSTDGTLETIQKLVDNRSILISEPDRGIYDALNKGIMNSTGEIIGALHSDDHFSDNQVISQIVKIFEDPSVDLVFGDLDYVSNSDPNKVIRHWVAGNFSNIKLSWGWMPPHPAVFIRYRLFETYGLYDTRYKNSGDYDLLLRYFKIGIINSVYINRVLVKMRFGGESNKSLIHLLRKTYEDYLALRRNNVGGILTVIWKNISKAHQFL